MNNKFDFLDLNNSLKSLWKYYLVFGILFLLLGAAALVKPGAFSISIIYVIGWFLMFAGFGNVFYAFAGRNNPALHWGTILFQGILELISAVIIILNPFYSIFFLVVYLGVFLIFRGFMLIFAKSSPLVEMTYLNGVRSLIVVNGILDILFGALALITPFFIEAVLVYTLAFYILFGGILLIVYGFQIKKTADHTNKNN